MKKSLFVIWISMFLLIGCTGVRTVSTGLENESFLQFIGNPSDYRGGVDVIIDDELNFKAKVYSTKVNRMKVKVYAIPTGKHTLKVSFKDNLLYDKQIFISAQETKNIILP